MIKVVTLPIITTTGSDGSATASARSSRVESGRVVAVHLNYSAGQAATTDVTLTAGTPAQTVLVVSNNATDGWYYPHTPAHLASDGSVVSGGTVLGVPVEGYINVSAAQADNGETVTVTLMLEA